MDLKKLYIAQSITVASNNLRLSTEKIEVVALLKDYLNKSENLSEEISAMKKITQLSKFAIHLNEVYNFISQSKIDFLKISDKFKEHSHYLIRDLSALLDQVTPAEFQEIINKLNERKKVKEPVEKPKIEEETEPSKKEEKAEHSFFDLPQSGNNKLIVQEIGEEERLEVEEEGNEREERGFEDNNEETGKKKVPGAGLNEDHPKKEKEESEIMKEEFLLDEFDEEKELGFDAYVDKILEPVKTLDKFLKDISSNEFSSNDIDSFILKMELNKIRSSRIGFRVLMSMHEIFVAGLRKIKENGKNIDEDFVESMRACLIVIVAVVRGKEVDITNYLNRAEQFGKQLRINT